MDRNRARPNIVLVLTDQHRHDCLGFAGDGAVKTPHLDRLAAAGTVFDAACSPSPVCGPARASLLTGLYPPGHGVVANWLAPRGEAVLLTDRLFRAGYYSALVGKLHLSPCRRRFGFDEKHLHDSPYDVYCREEIACSDYLAWLREKTSPAVAADFVRRMSAGERRPADDYRFWLGESVLDQVHHPDAWVAATAADFVDRYRGEKPFFLQVSFFGPHHPYTTCPPWDRLYDPAAVALPATFGREKENSPIFQLTKSRQARVGHGWGAAVFRRLTAACYGGISMIDAGLGRLFARLREKNLWDDTVVIFAADHGDHLGNWSLLGKADMYEGSVRVPLVIKPPARAGRAGRVTGPVAAIDLFGTVLDYAGDGHWRDAGLECGSLRAAAEGGALADGSPVYSLIGTRPGDALAMCRRGDLKLIGKAREGGAPLYELYDLAADPAEERNLYPAVGGDRSVQRLRRELAGWLCRQQARYPRETASFRDGER